MSALVDPEKEEDRIYQAVEELYMTRKKEEHVSRRISPETLNMNRCKQVPTIPNRPAWYFNYIFNDDLEQSMPHWNISYSELDIIFDKARFDRYLNYEINPDFKRRISWLYPPDGMHVLLSRQPPSGLTNNAITFINHSFRLLGSRTPSFEFNC